VVLAGVGCETDSWLRDPIERIMVFVQPETPSTYLERLRRIAADGARSVSLVFDSRARARRFGLQRHVLPPPIDVREFDSVRRSPRPRDSTELRIALIGQDRRGVVADGDAAHLRALAERAGRLAILDPGPLRRALGAARSVVCVPRDEHGVAPFLAGCDVYLHRTRPWWSDEPRALFGAMLIGVPVICHRDSMYAEYVSDGTDGWHYDDEAAALRIVDSLRGDASRVEAAGRAAREKASRVFEPRALGHAYVELVRQWATAL
jgi:glycosyltransferase involved in cell wall biosynthesis